MSFGSMEETQTHHQMAEAGMMGEFPRDAEGLLLPSLCSLQNRHLFLFQAFAALIQGQNGLCPFSSWQLFPYNSAQLTTLGKSSQPYPALQQTPWETLSHCQTRDGLCQPLCFSLHLVMNLRTLCAPCQPGIYQELLRHLLNE